MADPTSDAKSAKSAPGHGPRHASPSMYAPSPRESVVAAALAVALLSVLALVLANSGGSAAAERNIPVAASSPKQPAGVPLGLLDTGGSSAGSLIASGVPVLGTTAASAVASSGSTLFPGTTTGVGATAASSLAASGIPATALAAYEQAADRQDVLTPGCRISWPLLAGIGRVESNHGRFAGAVLHTDGLSTPPVIGIPLNGHGTAVIRDTDGGRLDGDTTYDRAVGPMQFIPSTWATWGVDADHDGQKNPFDIFDATAAAAAYLCAAGRDLGTYQGQVAAILSYNHSSAYVATVMGIERVYASGGGVSVPAAPGPGATGPVATPTLPPVDPGHPRGVGSPSTHSTSSHSTPSSRSSSKAPSSSSSPSTSSSTSKSSSPTKSSPSSPSSPSCPSSSPSSDSSSTPDTSSSSSSNPPPGCPTPSSSSSTSASDAPTDGGHGQGNAAGADASENASENATAGASGS